MGKWKKATFWVIGLILLFILIEYPIEYNSKKALESDFSLPLTGKTIVLDPGHGGPDGGAVGADGTEEKDISLQVSKMLRNYLQEAGAEVYLTRNEDKDLASAETKGLSRRKAEDIRNRLQMIEEKEPDVFISIHLNALSATQWRGAQSFYYPNSEENKRLAKLIQNEIIRNLENTKRDALGINSMYLLKHAKVPSALVEIGFLSNVEERELLKDEDYQNKMAASIYQGILRYVVGEEEIEE